MLYEYIFNVYNIDNEADFKTLIFLYLYLFYEYNERE